MCKGLLTKVRLQGLVEGGRRGRVLGPTDSDGGGGYAACVLTAWPGYCRMCSPRLADVFSIPPNVFTFCPNAFTFRPDVFTGERNVFTFRLHVFTLAWRSARAVRSGRRRANVDSRGRGHDGDAGAVETRLGRGAMDNVRSRWERRVRFPAPLGMTERWVGMAGDYQRDGAIQRPRLCTAWGPWVMSQDRSRVFA